MGQVIGWHVEVQISFRPIGYIAKLTREILGESKRSPRSVVKRTSEQIESCARQWAEDKFRDRRKTRLRDQLWAGVRWEFHFVHAVVKDPHELEVIASDGIILHPFHEVLSSLASRGAHSFSGSAGGDLAEIVSYYRCFDKQLDHAS